MMCVYNADTQEFELVSEEEAQSWMSVIEGLNETCIEAHNAETHTESTDHSTES